MSRQTLSPASLGAALSTTSPGKGEVGREAAGRGSPSRFSRTPTATRRAKALRHDPTEVEKKLWHALRRDQLGVHFRRQHPIGRYVVDFYCSELRLAIELDGGQHALADHRATDDMRTRWLRTRGVTVLRYWNNDVAENLGGVLEDIDRALRVLPPSPTLPLSGGGSGETGDSGDSRR